MIVCQWRRSALCLFLCVRGRRTQRNRTEQTSSRVGFANVPDGAWLREADGNIVEVLRGGRAHTRQRAHRHELQMKIGRKKNTTQHFKWKIFMNA